MSAPTLAALPPELLHHIMAHLPIPALLALGTTSHYLRAVQLAALTTLQLGAYPSHLDSVYASLDGAATHQPVRHHALLLPKADCHARAGVIRAQNARLAAVLQQDTHRERLRHLELALWELEKDAAAAVAQLRGLRSLALRLHHPHARHRDVDRAFWRDAPPGTVWNELYRPTRPRRPGVGSRSASSSSVASVASTSSTCSTCTSTSSSSSSSSSSVSSSGGGGPPSTTAGEAAAAEAAPPVLGQLEQLTLERAGITDYQLARILADNPGLTELRLRRCRTLTADFFAELARTPAGRRLRVLHFEDDSGGAGGGVDARVLEHVGALPALESLSLRGCQGIANAEVEVARREQGWRCEVVLPRPVEPGEGIRVAVDPAYK